MSKDMKRLTAPRSWPITRKTDFWVTKPSPGPHAIEGSMSVATVIRDMLRLCDTAKEARALIGERQILVDGREVKDHKLPVGLMDVISLPKTQQSYRMLLDRKGKLSLVKVPEGKEGWKLCRVENKTTVSGGKMQLNLHDGRNILVDENKYKTGDVLKIEIPSQKILDVYPLSKGSSVLVISGSHVGQMQIVEDFVEIRSSAPNIVKFKDGSQTTKDNIFVIGTKAPEIELPEERVI
jgi:small subunit ribosomal protein S4e